MGENLFAFIVLLTLTMVALGFIARARLRSAKDVLFDLEEMNLEGAKPDKEKLVARSNKILSDDLGKAGLLDADERSKFKLKNRLIPIFISLVLIVVAMGLTTLKAGQILAICAFGIALGVLLGRSRLRALNQRYIRDIEFHLPIVMERVVMAVQAGLDILPGISAIIDLEHSNKNATKPDPVTRLVGIAFKLTEAGLTFEQSLAEVAKNLECSALKHAFLHLGMAHREGGELMMPLRELSDSTQAYFQESTEEQIAKMPVKATMPLLFTFAGLIVCFITTPLLHVLHVAGDSVNKDSAVTVVK